MRGLVPDDPFNRFAIEPFGAKREERLAGSSQILRCAKQDVDGRDEPGHDDRPAMTIERRRAYFASGAAGVLGAGVWLGAGRLGAVEGVGTKGPAGALLAGGVPLSMIDVWAR